jgi:EpsI family protein
MIPRHFKRPMAVFLLMVATTAMGVVSVPDQKLADTRATFDLDKAVPKSFGDWKLDTSIVPLPPSPDQASLLSKIYDQILSRTYINSHGDRVMLSITYGSKQNQQLRAHRQEVCYTSQGFRVTDVKHQAVNIGGGPISTTQMVASKDSRTEPVTYWFTTGDTVVMSYWDREFAQFRYALSGFIPDGYLVRVSSLSDKPQAAFEQHAVFVNELLPHLDAELRRRLVGHG